MIEKIIKNVLELPDVDGACIMDKRGEILHNALPEYLLNDFLDDLSRRVMSMFEAVDTHYLPCDDYMLKYPQKYIQLRRSRTAYLLVIVEPTVNLVSLRMVTNLVLKHITPKVIGQLRADSIEEPPPAAESPLPPEPAPASEPAAASEPAPSQSQRKRIPRPRPARSFRGTQY